MESLRGEMVPLLDHGYVRLVDYMGNDLSVVRSARVSFDADWKAGTEERDARLIRRLMHDRHTTPFEAVVFTFEIKAPIMVFRQWHRHRTQSYNELSARYSELPEEFYVPEGVHFTTQNPTNKQGRTDVVHPRAEEFRERIRAHCETAFALYHEMLEAGVSREIARLPLPLGTYSRMFATANLLNWFRFLSLRMPGDAQMEIRVYAAQLWQLIAKVCPVSAHAFQSEQVGVDPKDRA